MRSSADFPPLPASRASPPQGGRWGAGLYLPPCVGGAALLRGGGGKFAEGNAKSSPHHAPFPVWSLKGSPGRVVLPNGTYLFWVWARHTPCHGFLPGLAHGALLLRAREGQEGHGLGSPPASGTSADRCHRPPALPNAGDHPVPMRAARTVCARLVGRGWIGWNLFFGW